MSDKRHLYSTVLQWTGNLGEGTRTYSGYGRGFEISVAGKPPILGSADVAFRGARDRYNPEELLVAALSACHMLWYLHLCSEAGIVVESYTDSATGTMVEQSDGSGCFLEAVLRPTITIREGGSEAAARELHEKAHSLCFIARSVSFPVRCEPEIVLLN